jgi:uncharacterized protein YndB with AHSA1/START domain
MKNSGNLTVTMPSDREIAMSRVFNAPRRLVFEAHTKCEYLKKWLGAVEGWTLDVCKIDREIVTDERIVATEKFDESWYEGEAVDTTTFVEKDGKTTLTVLVLYASKAVRDDVLKSGATEGLTANFDALDEVLATLSNGADK